MENKSIIINDQGDNNVVKIEKEINFSPNAKLVVTFKGNNNVLIIKERVTINRNLYVNFVRGGEDCNLIIVYVR